MRLSCVGDQCTDLLAQAFDFLAYPRLVGPSPVLHLLEGQFRA